MTKKKNPDLPLCIKLCGILKALFCWLILCIYTSQDSSVSIFDRLSGLITDSLLCTRPNFRDYPITSCVPTNKGASLPFTNWNEEWCQCSKERPITENYWIQKELKKKRDMWSALGCLWISSDFIRKKMAEAIPPDNSQLVCVGELCCPKISEKRKWKNHAVPLQFILSSELPQTILQLACG